MSTYEIGFYAVMGLASVSFAIWGLRRSVQEDQTPAKAYQWMSFSLWVLGFVILFRLFDAWSSLGDGWRFLAGLAFGLFSTTAAILLAQSRRLRRRREVPLES